MDKAILSGKPQVITIVKGQYNLTNIVKINSIHCSDYSVVYVKRGCFGTIPKLHTAGTDVYRLNVPKILNTCYTNVPK